ncbi:MAG: PQQ-dependent sugar dehydrogenase [Saprospiraceae bacterium]
MKFTTVVLRLIVCVLLLQIHWVASAQLLEDFTEELIGSNWNQPVGITFDEQSRGYVWEKAGRVYLLDSMGNKLPNPLIDISEEVLDWLDHGLLGFAVDPRFQENGYFYLLYAVDRHHLLYFGTPNYEADSTIINEASIGRITRYTADPATNFETTLANSRKILVGKTKETGIPILLRQHGIGSLVFGTDGTLLASIGDAAFSYPPDIGSQDGTSWEQALADGILRPAENVGSYRSQLVNSFNGKIIRIDPATGNGIPSNPFYDESNPRSAQSCVWALGLRNPYRMALLPGSGSHNPADANPGILYVGDVGASLWDEINIVHQPAQNFGWPLYEGSVPRWDFQELYIANEDSPNPLFGTNACAKAFFDFQDLLVQDQLNELIEIPNPCDPTQLLNGATNFFKHSRPAVSWSNIFWNKPRRAIVPIFQADGAADTTNIESNQANVAGTNFGGFASIGGNFNTGDNFPEAFSGAFFSADYSGWIRSFYFDDNHELYQVDTLHTNVGDVVSMAMHPTSGCLYYVNVSNKVRKICFGGHRSPIPVLAYDLAYGVSPLTVNFDGSASIGDDSPLIYEWKFGDGESSTALSPSHTFVANSAGPEAFTVQLTVTDTFGFSNTESQIISLNNTPPIVEINSFADGDLYPVSGLTNLPLTAQVTDAEHSASELSYAWQTSLFHNAHSHPGAIDERSGSFTILDPLGCLEQEVYHYGIELWVTDAAGLIGYDRKAVYPYCGDPIFGDLLLTGKATADGVSLSWISENEQGLRTYEIQRSNNLTNFQSIGEVPASGNTSGTENYSYTDTAPLFGTNYYRLRPIQETNVYDYSNTVSIKYPLDSEINLFPNPAREVLNIQLAEARGEVLFQLYSSTGQKLLAENWIVDSSEGFTKVLSTEGLLNGVYFYELNNGLQTYRGSFLILKE